MAQKHGRKRPLLLEVGRRQDNTHEGYEQQRFHVRDFRVDTCESVREASAVLSDLHPASEMN